MPPALKMKTVSKRFAQCAIPRLTAPVRPRPEYQPIRNTPRTVTNGRFTMKHVIQLMLVLDTIDVPIIRPHAAQRAKPMIAAPLWRESQFKPRRCSTICFTTRWQRIRPNNGHECKPVANKIWSNSYDKQANAHHDTQNAKLIACCPKNTLRTARLIPKTADMSQRSLIQSLHQHPQKSILTTHAMQHQC